MYHSGSYMQFPQQTHYPKPRSVRDNEEIKCDVCNISVRGQDQFNRHLAGAKHQKKIKEQENTKKIEEIPYVRYDEYSMGYACTICHVSLNSSSVAMFHIAGSRHQEAVKAMETKGTLPSTESGDAVGTSNGDGVADDVKQDDDQPSEAVVPLMSLGLPTEFGTSKVVPTAPNAKPGFRHNFKPRFNSPRPNASFPAPNMPYVNPMPKFRHQVKPLASSFVSKYTLHTVQATVYTGMNAAPRHRQPNAGPTPAKGQTFPCLACNIVTNSETQLQAHLSSEKHKNRLGPGGGPNGRPPVPPPIISALRCESCNITVNSQVQLDQHLQSPKHRNKLAMRYRPYPNKKPN